MKTPATPADSGVNYFVTGGTGLIGSELIRALLARGGTVHCLVRESSQPRFDALARRLGAGARLAPVHGDLTKPGLGVGRLGVRIDHMFHVGAVYDLEVDEARAVASNVNGTRHAVEFANANRVGRFHHVSSNGVAGRYRGRFLESMADEGQLVDHPYFRSKLDAEKIVRDQLQAPLRIYRPGITIGHSRTGWMDKHNGAYFFFGPIAALARWAPRWLPLVGPKGGLAQLVPVDFVARAIDHIGHLDDAALAGDGTFHLVPPEPLHVGEAIDTLAAAAGAPRFRLLLDLRLTRALTAPLRLLPGARRLRDAALRGLGIPHQAMEWRDFDAEFDTANASRALAGTGIEVPPLDQYAGVLFQYWREHLDPGRVPGKLRAAVDGQRVMVTGASSGVGRELTLLLGAAGAHVLLVARRGELLEQVADEIIGHGGRASCHPADLRSPDQTERLARTVLAEHGGVDVLVNNAGRSIRRRVEHGAGLGDYRRTMDVNYFAAVQLTLAFLPGMRERGHGRVLNISSIGLQSSMSRFTAYNSSKAALDAFARSLGPEVHSDGVRVTTVYLPLVRTDMSAPTKAFDRLPAWGALRAARYVARAVIAGRPRRSTALGTLAETASTLLPSLLRRIMRQELRLLPDTAPLRAVPDQPHQAAGRSGSPRADTGEAS